MRKRKFIDQLSCKISKIMRKQILDFITAKFVMGYPCVGQYILFFIHGPTILLFLAK